MEWKVVLETDSRVPSDQAALLAILQQSLPPGVRVSTIAGDGSGEPPARYHYLERSLALLTTTDQRLLDKEVWPVVCHRYEFGYWVFVDQDAVDDGRDNLRREFTRAGYSDGLLQLILDAREAGCWWIRFDRDAPRFEEGSAGTGQKQTLHVG